jgi:hypothetical protein
MLRDIFLNNAHPECQMVMNCLSKDKYNGEMKLSPALEEEFGTVEDFREALTSKKMYLYPHLYDLFCAGTLSSSIFPPMHVMSN